MIKLKTSEEIEILQIGGAKLAKTLATLKDACRVGVSTFEIDKMALDLIKKEGASPSFKGFKNYPANICISFNDEIVHGLPSERKFKTGDLVSLDLGLRYKNLCTDSAISFVVGREPDLMQQKLIFVCEKALYASIKEVSVGKRLGVISAKIQEVVMGAGFRIFPTLVGHGVGFAVHEEPPVPNLGNKDLGPELVKGMVIAVEPMISSGTDKIEIDKNGWTAKTKDGSLSAHAEHTIAITDSGVKILTLEKK